MTNASPHFVVQSRLQPQTDIFGQFRVDVTNLLTHGFSHKFKQRLTLFAREVVHSSQVHCFQSELMERDVHLNGVVSLGVFAHGQTGGLL